MKKIISVLILLSIIPLVLGESAPLDTELSDGDKAKFDQILEPVMKIYNFIKYIASVIAGIFLLFAGISYMGSGSDPKKRDQAKNIVSYVLIGLILIWVTPLVVDVLV